MAECQQRPLAERKYTIYCHIFPNGKRYVGQTCAPLYRRFGKNGSKYADQPYLYNAILKYGWNNIEHTVLASDLSYLEVDEVERYYIALYNCTNPDYGYNIETGGSLHKNMTEATREKLRQANLGKKLSEETCRKMGESRRGVNNPNYGVKYSDERRKQMSEARKGKPSGAKGRKCSEEVKQKIRVAKTGVPSHAVWTDEAKARVAAAARARMTPERRAQLSKERTGANNPLSRACYVVDFAATQRIDFPTRSALKKFFHIGGDTITKYMNSFVLFRERYLIFEEDIWND